MADRDLSRSRAILIGNAVYRSDSGIPDLPAAAGSVSAMADLLTGDLCRWPADRIVRLEDVAAPHVLARKVDGAVKSVRDVVLLYYVGHGLRTPKGQLGLALGDTDAVPTLVGHTAMLYDNVADILRGCPAATKLVILDCCHAELGNRANYIFQSADDLAEAYPVDGLYFIGASRMHQKAKTPVGGDLTYFTRAFVDTVREGIRGRPALLRLDQIFVELRDRLLRDNLPEPVESGTRGAHQYPFAHNAAVSVGPDHEAGNTRRPREQGKAGQNSPEPVRIDRARTTRILADTERVARSIPDSSSRASALAGVANAMAATDPARAARLITDAEGVARSIPDSSSRASALAGVANAVAATNPERAERVARSITDSSSRASALAGVANAMAATDPAAPPGSSPTRRASPGRSPTRARGHRHWPASRTRRQPPTRNVSPGRAPTRT